MLSLLKFQFISFIKSPMIVLVVGLPLLIILSLGTIMPQSLVASMAIGLSIMVVGIISFGYSYQSYKSSTLVKSLHLTKWSSFTVTLSFFIFNIILQLSMIGFILLFIWYLSVPFSYLNPTIDASKSGFPINWTKIRWGDFVYVVVVSTLLSLSIGYFFQTFIKTSTTFTIVSVMYILYNLLVGGLTNPLIQISSVPQANGETYSYAFAPSQNDTFLSVIRLISPHYYVSQLTIHQFAYDSVVGESFNIFKIGGESIFQSVNNINGLRTMQSLFIALPISLITFFFSTGFLISYNKDTHVR